MQVSNTILVVIAELYGAMLIGTIILFVHSRKLKALIRRQQEKLLELLQALKKQQPSDTPTPAPAIAPIPTLSPEQNYKAYLNEIIEVTAAQYAIESPDTDIGTEQTKDSPLFQRILALRYAFLRAEELGTTETMGSSDYWSIFQQALEPLLAPASDSNEELEACNKRIENLEKFKRLFFDMEKQWNNARTTAQEYYAQLMAMSDQVANKQDFTDILQQYHGTYDDVHNTIINTTTDSGVTHEQKTINITRQDLRAADEIVKLRNVAADQYRIINQLQRKLFDAKTSEEKEVIIQELQQQLLRQTRFVHESETCVQLLEDELAKAHMELSQKEKTLDEHSNIHEENKHMKEALHSFSLESKDLISNLTDLEKENAMLKQNNQNINKDSVAVISTENNPQLKKIQAEYIDLKKQYAELEERYLDLKLGN